MGSLGQNVKILFIAGSSVWTCYFYSNLARTQPFDRIIMMNSSFLFWWCKLSSFFEYWHIQVKYLPLRNITDKVKLERMQYLLYDPDSTVQQNVPGM